MIASAIKALVYLMAGLLVVAVVTVVLPEAIYDKVGERLGRLNPLASETVDRSGPTMLERIRNLEEFTAAEANFTQDVDVEEDTRLPGFIAGESVVAIVTGGVRATVDLSGLDSAAVQVDEKSEAIRIRLPEPVLGDADIDEESTRIIDRDRGVVDRISDAFVENPTDDIVIFTTAQERMNSAAQDSDLMERARANTESWFTTFLGAAGFEKVEITWPEAIEQ